MTQQPMTESELKEFLTTLRNNCGNKKKVEWYDGLIEDIGIAFTEHLPDAGETLEEAKKLWQSGNKLEAVKLMCQSGYRLKDAKNYCDKNFDEPKVNGNELHPDTENLLKVCFEELRLKLIKNQEKYGYSNEWLTLDWEQECREEMMKHIQKGDPRDVAIYTMFMIYRGWATAIKESKEPAFIEIPYCILGAAQGSLHEEDKTAAIQRIIKYSENAIDSSKKYSIELLSKEPISEDELINEYEKYLNFFLSEDKRMRSLAETMAQVAQQYTNSKLEELEKWCDEINGYDYFNTEQSAEAFADGIKEVKSKIQSLKQ